VQSFESSVHEVLAVVAPFVEITADKGRCEIRQMLASRVTRLDRWSVFRIDQRGNFIKKRLVKGAKLTVRRGPIPLGVGGNGLIKVPDRRF